MLIPELMMKLFVPLVGAADSLPGLLLIVLLVHVLWFCGLHGTNIVGVITAIMLTNLQANQAAMEAGEALPAIFAGGFLDSFVYLGGAGATLGLAIAMSISKSAHLRSIGRLSVVPGLFNINEPVIFGAPVIMNPILGIPFIGVPLINVTVAYLATSMDLVGRVVALVPWTTPGPLAAFLSTNFSVTALLLSLALVAFSTVAYLPFLNVYSRSLEAQESEQASGKAVTA